MEGRWLTDLFIPLFEKWIELVFKKSNNIILSFLLIWFLFIWFIQYKPEWFTCFKTFYQLTFNISKREWLWFIGKEWEEEEWLLNSESRVIEGLEMRRRKAWVLKVWLFIEEEEEECTFWYWIVWWIERIQRRIELE